MKQYQLQTLRTITVMNQEGCEGKVHAVFKGTYA
jgi:hypothetical protein